MAEARNKTLDILRGIAMLMVVMGHTMTGCTQNAESTLVFNIIWSIQMPLFFLISGYVTCYGKAPENGKQLFKLFVKRTRAYLLPWAVWTMLIRGLLLGERQYLNLRYLLWNMDAGYWFLFSLWTISLIFAVSQFAAMKCGKKESVKKICTVLVYVAGAVVLAGMGLCAGLTFLGIKLTLYYMLFYGAGVAFSWLYKEKTELFKKTPFVAIIFAVCLVIYAALIIGFDLYAIPDDLRGIAIRCVVALCGCACLTALVSLTNLRGIIATLLQWVGRNSLAIYLAHGFFLCIIVLNPLPLAASLKGAADVLVNFVITVVLSAGVAALLDRNRYVRYVFLGK